MPAPPAASTLAVLSRVDRCLQLADKRNELRPLPWLVPFTEGLNERE